MLSPVPSFVHRRNYNGTYDSICTKCFRTVSSQLVEVELEDDEIGHQCSGSADSSTLKEVNIRMLQMQIDTYRTESV